MGKMIRPLAHYLARIVDPRHAKGLRHPLAAILCLCCVALMSGAMNPLAIAHWWRNRLDLGPFLQRLGFTKGYGPSKSTLYRVLALIPVEVLEAILQQWAEENLADIPLAAGEMEAVALDGKVLRGSEQQGAGGTYLLSAFSQRLGLTLRQLGVQPQSNEIGAASPLLAALFIEGRIWTMDALLTQRQIAQTIVDRGGDYLMIVKENQATLHDDLETLFADPLADRFFVTECTQKVEKEHGRLGIRTLRSSTALNDYLDWPGLQQVFHLDRQTTYLKSGSRRAETVYGLTSLSPEQADAAQLLQLQRGQWQIENRSHYVRDVTFGEDKSQVRKGYLPQVMAALRNTVIGLLRLLHFPFIPEAFDFFAVHPDKALAAIGS